MKEYKKWLEYQIERCLNDKDLQREHWAFCKAYEKFILLSNHNSIMPSLPTMDEIKLEPVYGSTYCKYSVIEKS